MRGLAIVALAGLIVAGGVLVVATDPLSIISYVPYTAIGALLVIRRPRNLVGWLVLGLGIWPLTNTSSADAAAVAAGTADTGTKLVVWLGAWSGALTYTGYLCLAIFFPSGQLPGGRARAVAIAALSVALVIVILMAFGPTISYNGSTLPNPYPLLPDLPLWRVLPPPGYLFLPLLAVVSVGVLSLIARFRRATGVLRLQLRWLVTALAFVAAALAFGLLGSAVIGDVYTWVWIPAIFAFPSVPIAIGFAVLRYRLYEIDRIVSRTLGWALVTAVILAVFAGTVVGLQALLIGITGSQTVPVAASTLLAFALFQPLRSRVQSVVDRRFNRARYDAELMSIDFAQRLRDQVDLGLLSGDIAGVVDSALHPSTVAVWIRPPGQAGTV
jgi:hypothetical protein